MTAFLARLWEALTRRIDTFLLTVAMAIVSVGLITLYSATDQSFTTPSSPPDDDERPDVSPRRSSSSLAAATASYGSGGSEAGTMQPA